MQKQCLWIDWNNRLAFKQVRLKITSLSIFSFSSQLDTHAHTSPWLPHNPEPVLASERAFPNRAFRQRHGGWDVDCEHGGYVTSLGSALLLNPFVPIWSFSWERSGSFSGSCVWGLPILSLCAVMGSSSSLGCHKQFAPHHHEREQTWCLTLTLPRKS